MMTTTIKFKVYINLSFRELVEDTIHEALPLLSGDIIIDHGIATLKILAGSRSGWKNMVSNILAGVLLVEFMVWAWILSYGWWFKYWYPSVLLSSEKTFETVWLPLSIL